jgi:hypothetical protein
MLKVSATAWTSLIFWRSLKRLRRGCRAIRLLALSDLPSIFFRMGFVMIRNRNCGIVVRLVIFGGLGTNEGASIAKLSVRVLGMRRIWRSGAFTCVGRHRSDSRDIGMWV